MSEKEKAILDNLGEVLPKLPEREKGYLLGYGEAMVALKEEQKKEEDKKTILA